MQVTEANVTPASTEQSGRIVQVVPLLRLHHLGDRRSTISSLRTRRRRSRVGSVVDVPFGGGRCGRRGRAEARERRRPVAELRAVEAVTTTRSRRNCSTWPSAVRALPVFVRVLPAPGGPAGRRPAAVRHRRGCRAGLGGAVSIAAPRPARRHAGDRAHREAAARLLAAVPAEGIPPSGAVRAGGRGAGRARRAWRRRGLGRS